jgi:hypothetical protein
MGTNTVQKVLRGARRYPKLAIVLIAVLSGCAYFEYSSLTYAAYLASPEGKADTARQAASDVADQKAKDEKYQQDQKISMAEAFIGALLRDPASAEWLGVKVVKSGGKDVVCGMVNGNNAFGGKAGYESFADVYEQNNDVIGKVYMTSRGSKQAEAVNHYCPD